ncbi:hypothetical protein [Bacteroides cutis]|uniref:hypothetical protein n=1 Tax=Bacteroides cutis TaxID=2024197 RepID=UPI0015E0FB71|nr:hypothetical protein [Bacteroides cutis]
MDTINLQPSMEDVVPISWHSFANIVARQCQYCGKSVPLYWQQHVNGWWIE